MLRFFRKIRQQFLLENQVSKYLLYAFGEILLVMIGILLALQVNNWNEVRKQDLELQSYLFKIANNMEQDFVIAKDYILRRDSLKSKSQQAVLTIDNKEFDFKILQQAAACFVEFYFIANKSGFEALKSSGFIGKIKNPKIDALLHEYYAIVGQIEKKEQSYNAFIENMEVAFNLNHPAIKFKKQVYFRDYFPFPEKAMKPKLLNKYFQSNAFQAAVGRTAIQDETQRAYRQLIDVGEAFIKEVKNNYE